MWCAYDHSNLVRHYTITILAIYSCVCHIQISRKQNDKLDLLVYGQTDEQANGMIEAKNKLQPLHIYKAMEKESRLYGKRFAGTLHMNDY